MAGRLYTPVIFVAAILLGRFDLPRIKPIKAVVVLVFAVGCASYMSSYGSYVGAVLGEIAPNGSAPWDEWKTVLSDSNGNANLVIGLMKRNGNYKEHYFYYKALPYKGSKVFVWIPAGICRLALGDKTYIVDEVGLTNPVLARLPAVSDTNWTIGHLTRHIPMGYIKTLTTGVNVIEDPNLHEYYDKLHLITNGPIFSKKRFETILKMNLGEYDYLIDKEKYRYGFPGETLRDHLGETGWIYEVYGN
jgi:arabinofuranosyltransferase